MLIPDFDQASRFLELLAPGEEEFTFQTFDDNKERRARSGKYDPHAHVRHGTLAAHANELIRLNQNQIGIFVMVNAGDGIVHGAGTCRTTASVIRVRALYVDLDGAPLEPVTQHPVHPNIIVETSPARWHAYWLTDDCPLDRFKGAQKALIKQFNSDRNVNDLARVMRLPGFFHQKTAAFQTRLICQE